MSSPHIPSRSGAAPDLSVVVPTYGRPDAILALLDRLADQTLPPGRFEVLVVDDGSSPPIELDASLYPFTLVLQRQSNAGPGAARNRALAVARAPLTLILNDDAVPAPNLLERHLSARASARPKTALLGSFRFTARALASPFVQLLSGSNLLFDFPALKHGARLGWPYFWTCNISLPTAVLRAVGGFDAENFREPIVEDVELGFRLEQLGWQVEYRDDLVCEHDHVLEARGYFKRMVRLGVNMARMADKHGRPDLLYTRERRRVEAKTLAALQQHIEAFHSSHVAMIDKLDKLDAEHWGKTLPTALVEQISGLIRRIGLLDYWRGLMLHYEGHDPFAVLDRGPRTDGLVSIAMVSFNALDKTRKCLEALRAAADPRIRTELIVVDNGSSDGSAEWLAQQPDVELIRNAENRGAPLARNQALERVRGEWIVVMDNDAIVSPGWLERLLFHAQVDARSGCVGPLSDRAAHGQQIPYSGEAELESVQRFAAEHARRNHRRSRPQNILTSFLLLMRREVLDAIGGFDERFSPWGFEDDDFTLRATLAGFRNRCALDVFVRHEHYGGAKAARHNDLLQRNWKQFAAKWGGRTDAAYGDYSSIEGALGRKFERSELHVPLANPPAALPCSTPRLQPSEA